MYEKYYGLTARPFQLTPDPRYFFGSRGHNRALAYLRYGVGQGEGFIVVTGDIGTGKTTLVRMLCDELSREQLIIAQLVSTQLDADDTLRVVAQALDIHTENATKAILLKRIETFLEQQARNMRRVLLIVDEAQNLPWQALEELRMLSNFTFDGRPGLQSFLLGQMNFRDTMRSPRLEQFRQRVIAACHLIPLEQEEVRNYVEHRLRLAGWNGRLRFEDDVFETAHRITAGIPRRINTLFDRILLFGFLEERESIDRTAVLTVAEELLSELPPADSGEVENRQPGRSTDAMTLLDNEFVSLNDLHQRVVALENRLQSVNSSLNKVIDAMRRGDDPDRYIESD